MSARRRRGDAGFTIVEVMVATTLLGIVLLIVYGTLNSGVRHAADAEARVQIEADVRGVADTFVRDVRQAYTGDLTLNRIDSMTATSITFYSPDRATPYHIRKISYRLTGVNLERSVTTSTDADGAPWTFGATGPYAVVLKDVRSTTVFTYRDHDGAITTDAAEVATVQLSLTVDHDTTQLPGALSYTTTAEVRGA
jgi:prepilin-type N-terminal cleavage/methylation domain-containing protein